MLLSNFESHQFRGIGNYEWKNPEKELRLLQPHLTLSGRWTSDVLVQGTALMYFILLWCSAALAHPVEVD